MAETFLVWVFLCIESCLVNIIFWEVAAGPVGRSMEGDVAVRSAAAFYTYSRTRGLYAGLSLVGTALIERKGANAKFERQCNIVLSS